MKTEFVNSELEVIRFTERDIIMTSVCSGDFFPCDEQDESGHVECDVHDYD